MAVSYVEVPFVWSQIPSLAFRAALFAVGSSHNAALPVGGRYCEQ